MATTLDLAVPYPASTDAPDGSGGLYNLANWIENHVAPRDRMFHARYNGSTDMVLNANGTTGIQYDTAIYDPLGMFAAAGGSASAPQSDFTLPIAGRWSFFVRAATTVQDLGGNYGLGTYNVAAGTQMSLRGQNGIFAGMPMEHYTEEILPANFKFRANVYRSSTGADWITHGAGQIQLAPELIARWLGAA